MNLEEHLKRQIAFSRATFGPGERRKGCCDHIRKEIDNEILPETVDEREASKEWVDVVILALDGLTRALIACGYSWETVPHIACRMIQQKQARNEQRDWPDWRTADPEKAIEHVRTPTAPEDARPCSTDAFLGAILKCRGTVDEIGALSYWHQGLWSAALSFLPEEARKPLEGGAA